MVLHPCLFIFCEHRVESWILKYGTYLGPSESKRGMCNRKPKHMHETLHFLSTFSRPNGTPLELHTFHSTWSWWSLGLETIMVCRWASGTSNLRKDLCFEFLWFHTDLNEPIARETLYRINVALKLNQWTCTVLTPAAVYSRKTLYA